MGQQINLSYQVQGILPPENGGTGSLASLVFVDNETPSGTVDGVNSTFSLATAPAPPGSLLFVIKPPSSQGGVQLSTIDYTLTGNVITTTAPPVSGSNLRAWYRANQKPLLIKGEQLTIADTAVVVLQSRISLSDSLTLTDSISFVLAVSNALFNGQLAQQDAFIKILYNVETPTDTMILSDHFVKLLV